METIYLAGGMRSDWRDELIAEFRLYLPDLKIRWICPCKDDALAVADDYTAWDLFWVRRCDVLFAYMEADNPSGVGLAVEIATAKALGKTVVYVDEKGDRYMEMVASLSDFCTSDAAEGRNFLATLLGGAGVRDGR